MEAEVALLAVAGSFLLWTNLYFITYLVLYTLNRTSALSEFACRVITIIHGLLLSTLGLESMFIFGPWPFNPENLAQPNTKLHTEIVVLSLGYFFFDLFWCVWTRTEGLVMLMHHAVSTAGFGYVLLTDRYGCEATGVLGVSEATNPLLQLRWFLKHGGYYSGPLERAVDWSFAALFWSARLGAGTAFFHLFFFSPRVDLFPRLGATGFYIISVAFSIQIALYMFKKYFR